MTLPMMLNPTLDSTSGSSDAAIYVALRREESFGRMRDSVSLGFGATLLLEDFEAIFRKCKTPNWDGYGAAPVRPETFLNAYRFLQALPWGTPPPSIGVEPDGHLTLEWYRSPRRTLSVSISPDGQLFYAALLGPGNRYGTEIFVSDVAPAILDLIEEVCVI